MNWYRTSQTQDRDLSIFNRLIKRLEEEGREISSGDALTPLLGDEKFSYKTRSMVAEIMGIIDDRPEFADMIPANLMKFFKGYIMPKDRKL